MQYYITKASPLAGSNWKEVLKKAFSIYKEIRRRSRRRSYVRSVYFNKQKIFLPLFWSHLYEKLNHRDKTRRLKLYPCALELIQHTRFDPEIKQSSEEPDMILHRFAGKTRDGQKFFAQIKENMKTGEKWFISTFPE